MTLEDSANLEEAMQYRQVPVQHTLLYLFVDVMCIVSILFPYGQITQSSSGFGKRVGHGVQTKFAF